MAMGFKEIFWDSGGVWVLVLAMTLVWLFNTLKDIIDISEKMKKG